MDLIIKAILGALIVVLISMLSSTKYYFLAGIIPLFPTFALIAHVIVGQNGAFELRQTVVFGMLSLIPYFFYLLSVYLLSDKLSLYVNLFVSTLVWTVFAVLIYLLWLKIKIYVI